MLQRFQERSDTLSTSASDSDSSSEASSTSEDEEEEVDVDGEEDEDDLDDGESTDPLKPYRYFVFDIECSQDEQVKPGQFKHRPMLICAELICTACISAGIQIGTCVNNNNNNISQERPQNCVCGGADRMQRAMRPFVVPNTDGRCFRFDNFDEPDQNPVDKMLDFLTKKAPKNAITIALSHNGYYYY